MDYVMVGVKTVCLIKFTNKKKKSRTLAMWNFPPPRTIWKRYAVSVRGDDFTSAVESGGGGGGGGGGHQYQMKPSRYRTPQGVWFVLMTWPAFDTVFNVILIILLRLGALMYFNTPMTVLSWVYTPTHPQK